MKPGAEVELDGGEDKLESLSMNGQIVIGVRTQ